MTTDIKDTLKEVQLEIINPILDFNSFVTLLSKNQNIEDIINKLKLNVDELTKKTVLDIFSLLTQDSEFFKNICKNLEEIVKDGKIDTYDIPLIIKIVTDILNQDYKKLKNIEVTIKHISLVIKIIIMVLLGMKVIKTDSFDEKTIFSLIDSSLLLLETTVSIKKFKLFCCC